MEELNIKIEELERKIGTLELDVKRLLNYGNVPDRNWAEAFDIMLTRERLKSALDEAKDVKAAIKSNSAV